jgi:hypothetical protein
MHVPIWASMVNTPSMAATLDPSKLGAVRAIAYAR